MTVVIACLDARVDLDLEGGDYAVLRNLGGRVTPDVLTQLAILGVLTADGDGTDVSNVVVVHHTDCDTSRLADPELAARAAVAAGVEVAELEDLVVDNPAATVTADVGLLRKVLGRSARITGIVYDVASGESRVAWRTG